MSVKNALIISLLSHGIFLIWISYHWRQLAPHEPGVATIPITARVSKSESTLLTPPIKDSLEKPKANLWPKPPKPISTANTLIEADAMLPKTHPEAIVPPRLRRNVDLSPLARDFAGHELRVVIELTIDIHGQIQRALILSPSVSTRLATAITDLFEQLVYFPALQSGNPVVSKIKVELLIEPSRALLSSNEAASLPIHEATGKTLPHPPAAETEPARPTEAR